MDIEFYLMGHQLFLLLLNLVGTLQKREISEWTSMTGIVLMMLNLELVPVHGEHMISAFWEKEILNH